MDLHPHTSPATGNQHVASLRAGRRKWVGLAVLALPTLRRSGEAHAAPAAAAAA